ncbi:high-affnity carbon uptake protein hat/hatR [Vibrio ishigakensis]|uniref:histidine kinase n=1 Tax=Vibrio ishigakensis TaxID=1481914 RepID=A0A0B8P023_9VIBR|nr:high-affnity carbon uptake protein hat/hatR [Vibrio ishigakensis]
MEQAKNRFQVGGSISEKSSIYIKRAADVELFEALKRQELCYVFNSRQVGKSSLLVSVKSALMELGFRCCFLDMSRIGSIQPTQEQWYAGIISELWRGFSLPKGQAMFEWWNEQGDIPAAQKFSHFIQDKLPRSLADLEMVIFIDEIDSVLSLPFPADDFFSVIRASFNQRADQLAQNVVNFAFFGVALPSDLVSEPSRSPFNIGTAIKLEGFTLPEATPLASGLKIEEKSALAVLSRIIYWTGGQPFLTQKVCQLINNQLEKQNIETFSDTGSSLEDFVDTSIYEHIIDSWENKDNPEHLKTIMDRLLHDEAYSTLNLDLYSQLLKTGSYQIDSNGDDSWRHLYLTGIISHHENTLRVRTRIYREVFNSDWIDDLLEKKRPYSEAFKLWHKTNDDAYLLSGEALSDAKVGLRTSICQNSTTDSSLLAKRSNRKKVEESNTRLIEEVKSREQAEKELKNTLELLREANTRIESANSAKSNFVTRVSKEVRTPINSILGLGFLAMQHDSSPLIQDYLSKIYRSAGYLLNVVNDIVDINKLERNELTLVHETFWLDDIIDNVIDIVTPKMHENSVELKVELPTTPPIIGDPVRLQQLILNLMSNAIRFTEEGTISLKVGVLSLVHNQINLSFIIQDSGIGFSAKKISCTLNKEQKGHLPIGLGLEFCTDLLSLWGSELDIQSTPRVGSRLQFDLGFNVDSKTDNTNIHDLFTVAIIGSKPFITQLTGQVQSLSHQVIDAGQDLSDLQEIASSNKQLKIDKVLLEFTDNASIEHFVSCKISN